jgi:serine/threonine-protein kinase
VLKSRDVIAGRYRLDSPIGEGAMGAVWRAEDQTLKRQVAIKFLYVRGARDPQAMVDQFLREARIAASIQHRNVIHTVDFGTVDDFQPFMVMELLSGESLGERIAREPPLSSEQLIHIMSLTLRGLSAVHDAGIVHRDLKPANIFLQRDSDAVYPKILDFGISRSLNGGGERPSAIATQEGLIIGTPDYMSPEQARGELDVDRRADIYSMGAILFEGLTGRLPFIAKTVGDLIVQIVTAEPPRASDVAPSVPKPLSDLIAQAMSKNREHRFTDARALRRALLAAAESSYARGGRIAASLPPEPVHAPAGQGKRGAGPPSPPGAALQSAAWGDFEGLEAPRIRDDNPPPPSAAPSFAPPKQQRLVAQAGDAALELSSDRAPAPVQMLTLPEPVPAPAIGAGRPNAARRPAPARAAGTAAPSRAAANARARAEPDDDLASALDAINEGRDKGSIDLDHDRIRLQSQGQPRKRERPPSPQRPRIVATRQEPKSSAVAKIFAWLLPIAVIAAIGYVVFEAELREAIGAPPPAAPSAAQVEAIDMPSAAPGARARRENPGKAPAHMRDVVF